MKNTDKQILINGIKSNLDSIIEKVEILNPELVKEIQEFQKTILTKLSN